MDSMEDGKTLAHAMVDTVRDALLVLDKNLKVVAASRSFYSKFLTTPSDTIGHRIYDLGNGEWQSEALRHLLERVIPEHDVMDDFVLEQNFARLGPRVMLLNARKVFYKNDTNSTLLLAIEDITERRNNERLLKALSDRKDTLMAEMSHRVANSLQIIASILLLKARKVTSDETRGHLEDAHRRVMSVAALQQQLTASGSGEKVEIGEYLTRLCESLAASMIGDRRSITIRVFADPGAVVSERAVGMGLVVTELAINALKHAFPPPADLGEIKVEYKVSGEDWTLAVSDNGCGMSGVTDHRTGGLGTSIVKALAQQLEAEVVVATGVGGTRVSVEHHQSEARLH
ncbi:sensor histidine kinase [Aestuariivirga litoralis]|uniref:sensor histidine kinase n=1 Tax=Aestuariivirga litoralis TaxID=2650924 RepID=UPI0018C81266|nr:PAS domain-containing sensor histidine kinase [Aestuariivirga litoralis]MBG1232794.1 PAS domain-containing protein [Aestuariivirga litoralis]